MIEGLIIAMALLAGAVCAVVWAKRARQRRLSEVAAQAEKHRQQAELDVRQVREQAERDAAEQATQAQRTVEQEQLVFAEEQRRVESLLQRKSKRIEQREAQLEQREGEVDRRYRELRELRRQTKDIRDAARERREARTRALEERAAETAAEVAQSMADRMVEEVRSECADRLRNLDSGAEEFNREAKRVMSIIMQRYTGHCVRERGAMTMQLPQGAWDKLQKDNAELLSKLSESTDVGLVPSDDQLSLRLESSDGVARETCRRVLTRALGEPVRNVDQLIEATQTALERELHAQGKDAFAQLGLPPADPEIVDLVGRLNYRTSYTQNQWRHAIEAGHLAGMMAQELGLAGELTAGRILAFAFLVTLFVGPVQMGTQILTDAQNALAGWRRVIGILETPADLVDPGPAGRQLPSGPIDVAFDGVQALERIRGGDYDLVVLDVMMPELDGLAVCQTLRAEGNEVPILFLTARGRVEDRITGLQAGGDDYLAKPFALRELLLRVGAIVRRRGWYRAAQSRASRLEFGGNQVDFGSYRAASWDGETHHLTHKEAMILKALSERAGEVVSREDILEQVWGYDVYPSTRTIDNFLVRLRKRFERDPEAPRHLHTVRGVGYRFTLEAESTP